MLSVLFLTAALLQQDPAAHPHAVRDPSQYVAQISRDVRAREVSGGLKRHDAKRLRFELQTILEEERLLKKRFGGELPYDDKVRLDHRLDDLVVELGRLSRQD